METKLETRRLTIFLAFAFGIAWATGLVIYLTGGLVNSPVLAPNTTLALVLLATFYMWAPALGNIFTRLITREGWANTWLRFNLRRGWPSYLAAWFLPSILTIVGGAVFYMAFPQYFDPNLGYAQRLLEQAGQAGATSPWTVVLSQLLVAVLLFPFVNGLATFGEEFGWRAYLLPKLMPLGGRTATVVLGLIWGVWHWPVIFMGYEYGFNYPGAPWLGPLIFLFFTLVVGIFLAWVTLRSGSVWPAVIGHGAVNSIAGIMIFFVQGTPNPLLGPLPVGILGAIGYAILAALLFASPDTLHPIPWAPPIETAPVVEVES